ncbi:MAG TPA: acylneuraminate cytidylyltransferase family protein [Opitutaceae bacterium]|nr:acylneuraminate cytidylyltransferase family protein [Opitutaceae bacterium]
MKTACFIPIKQDSERVPGKNLRRVGGVPLYQAIIVKALDSGCFARVFVDTNSAEIAAFARQHGATPIARQPALALPSANGNDLLNHHAAIEPDFDCYFQLFATAPLLKIESIQGAVARLLDSAAHDSVLTTIEHKGFFWRAGMPVSYQPNLLPRSQDLMPIVEETTALYGITRASLLKYRSRIGATPFFFPVSAIEAVDLNTEDDFAYLEWLVATGRAELLPRERRELIRFSPACAA